MRNELERELAKIFRHNSGDLNSILLAFKGKDDIVELALQKYAIKKKAGFSKSNFDGDAPGYMRKVLYSLAEEKHNKPEQVKANKEAGKYKGIMNFEDNRWDIVKDKNSDIFWPCYRAYLNGDISGDVAMFIDLYHNTNVWFDANRFNDQFAKEKIAILLYIDFYVREFRKIKRIANFEMKEPINPFLALQAIYGKYPEKLQLEKITKYLPEKLRKRLLTNKEKNLIGRIMELENGKGYSKSYLIERKQGKFQQNRSDVYDYIQE